MQAVYWYAVLLLQPTLYLVSAPGPLAGAGDWGQLGGKEGTSLAENGQTHCNYPVPVLPRSCPGSGGIARRGVERAKPATCLRGRGAPPEKSGAGGSRDERTGATSRAGSPVPEGPPEPTRRVSA